MNRNDSVSKDVLRSLPADLPEPIDDGACDHLSGVKLPSVKMVSTKNGCVDLSSLTGWVVLYIYPMTGKPGIPVPEGWVETPGAAGCTPQSCSYRDNYSMLQSLGAKVFGISAQTTSDQVEAMDRLMLPYELLSDSSFEFANAIDLPLFEIGNRKLIKRVTLICHDGIVKKYFYPVFPPDKNVNYVIEWLKSVAHNNSINSQH
jgi:peroxiredoxin